MGPSESFLRGVNGLSWLLSGDLTGVAGLGASMLDSSFSEVDVMSLVSSSSPKPWACDWWYFKPLICLYFFEQFGSGHSKSIGEGGGLPQGAGAGGGTTLVFLPLEGTFPPDCWDCVSSSPTLFFLLLSGRGRTKGAGEDGAVEGPEPFGAPRRPLIATPPPLRSLLCTEDLVSVN